MSEIVPHPIDYVIQMLVSGLQGQLFQAVSDAPALGNPRLIL